MKKKDYLAIPFLIAGLTPAAAFGQAVHTFPDLIEDDKDRDLLVTPTAQYAQEGDEIMTLLGTPGDEAVRFSAEGLPAGLTIHAETGAVTGELGQDSSGIYRVRGSATSTSLTETIVFPWYVLEADVPQIS